MAEMRLRVHRLLKEGVEADAPRLDTITVKLAGNEKLLDVVRRVAGGDAVLSNAICENSGRVIRSGIIVVHNDVVISPGEFPSVVLQDGDEVTFLPMIDGG